MLSDAILERTTRDNIDFTTFDKCILATFHLLCFKKFGRTDLFQFNIDTTNSVFEILNKENNESILLDFGRKVLTAGKKNLWALIYVSKSHPKEFENLYNYAITNQHNKYYALIKTIDFRPAQSGKEARDKNIDDFQDEKDDDHYETGPFCPACQEAPCMCSDPHGV